MKSEAFNQDCMIAMAAMPDKAFDLAIVDPPYGYDGIFRGSESFANDYKQYENEIPSAEYFTQLFRVSVNQIIWGGNYFTLPPSRGFIVWDKIKFASNYSQAEFAWTSFDAVARMFRFCSNGGFVTAEIDEKIHPTQKPVALYKWLLTNYAKPGQTILDTHLGSGSSRIAAFDLGFDFTGYELDPDYFAAQEERFARHCQQPKLFAPDAAAVRQENLSFE